MKIFPIIQNITEQEVTNYFDGTRTIARKRAKTLLLLTLLAFSLSSFLTCAAFGATRVDVVGDIEPETGFFIPAELLAAEGDVDMLIDSNGGMLQPAQAVIAALEARTKAGKVTRCYALKAISAAFLIFSYCTERYVAPYGKYMAHYPYIITPRVTVDNIEELRDRLRARKAEVDVWAGLKFPLQVETMKRWMVEEIMSNGIELCRTFLGFCRVSYIFPILEETK